MAESCSLASISNKECWASISALGSQILALEESRVAASIAPILLDRVAGFSREYGYPCLAAAADAVNLNVFRGPHVKNSQKFAKFRFVQRDPTTNVGWAALRAASRLREGTTELADNGTETHQADGRKDTEVPIQTSMLSITSSLEALVLGAVGLSRWRALRATHFLDSSQGCCSGSEVNP
jgi:hypothetical protein